MNAVTLARGMRVPAHSLSGPPGRMIPEGCYDPPASPGDRTKTTREPEQGRNKKAGKEDCAPDTGLDRERQELQGESCTMRWTEMRRTGMRSKLRKAISIPVAGLIVGLSGLALTGCSGGSSGGGGLRIAEDLGDPIIEVEGAPGRFSRTPEEANEDNGATLPPQIHPVTTTQNHFFRLEFPFRVTTDEFLLNDPLLAPFSFLNGQITVTDANGNHVPGIAMVNGVDLNGVNRSAEPGFRATSTTTASITTSVTQRTESRRTSSCSSPTPTAICPRSRRSTPWVRRNKRSLRCLRCTSR